jgi:hypothetical protein
MTAFTQGIEYIMVLQLVFRWGLSFTLHYLTMCVYTADTNQERVRSNYPTLRATAAEFVPRSQRPDMLRTPDKTHDPLQPIIAVSPAFQSVKDWIQDQTCHQMAPLQPLPSPTSKGKNFLAAGSAHRGKHLGKWAVQRKRNDKLLSSNNLAPHFQSNTDRLYAISPPRLQAANPFQEQIERIDKQLAIVSRGSMETLNSATISPSS